MGSEVLLGSEKFKPRIGHLHPWGRKMNPFSWIEQWDGPEGCKTLRLFLVKGTCNTQLLLGARQTKQIENGQELWLVSLDCPSTHYLLHLAPDCSSLSCACVGLHWSRGAVTKKKKRVHTHREHLGRKGSAQTQLCL